MANSKSPMADSQLDLVKRVEPPPVYYKYICRTDVFDCPCVSNPVEWRLTRLLVSFYWCSPIFHISNSCQESSLIVESRDPLSEICLLAQDMPFLVLWPWTNNPSSICFSFRLTKFRPWWQHHLALLGLSPWVLGSGQKRLWQGIKEQDEWETGVPSSSSISALRFILLCLAVAVSLCDNSSGMVPLFWVQKSLGPHKPVFSARPVPNMIEWLLTFHLWGSSHLTVVSLTLTGFYKYPANIF